MLNASSKNMGIFIRFDRRNILVSSKKKKIRKEEKTISNKNNINVKANGTQTNIDQKTTELAGLCVTCDERHHCTIKKPHGGVWYCDEYR